jgi:hypothetical protein
MINLQSQRDASFTTAVGTTTRPPTTALLTIDSEDRFNDLLEKRASVAGSRNWSPYNFTITKNESLMNGFFTRLAVSEIVFPWTIPNINAKTLGILVDYKVGLGPIETANCENINVGFYTPLQICELISAYVTALDASLAGFSMGYGNNGLPVINYSSGSATTSVAFRPYLANNLPNVITDPPGIAYYPYSNNTKQLFDVLGFTSGNSVLAYGGPGSLQYGNATFCVPIRYVDIVCTQLTYNQALKDTSSQVVSRDALCRLYLGNGSGSHLVNYPLNQYSPSEPPPLNQFYTPVGCTPFVIYQQYNNPKQIQWQPNQPVPGYLVFQVYDDVGELLETSSNYYGNNSVQTDDWSMTLLVSEN